MAKEHLLGEGIFGWLAEERIYGKYGSVMLEPNVSRKTCRPLWGRRGRLEVVIVSNEAQGVYLYDPITGKRPSLPKVGERFVLGEGTFFSYHKYHIESVGVSPDDEDKAPVLDLDALYKASNQYVALYFVEE